jgi:signal peptidase I
MRRPTRIVLLLLTLVGAALLAVGVTSKVYRIPSASMEPTLHCSRDEPFPGCTGDEADRIAVSRVLYRFRDPKRGDVVAYRVPSLGARRCGVDEGTTFLHRIVGLPGERVAVVRGVAVVNGRRLDEPYVSTNLRVGAMPTRALAHDEYIVLGDNRAQSCDSRAWGELPRDRIIGPRIATYWPLGRLSIG